jgi:hypothetical protein
MLVAIAFGALYVEGIELDVHGYSNGPQVVLPDMLPTDFA